MFPSFDLFGRTINMYPVMAVTGLLISGAYACRIARKRGYDDNVMIMFLLIAGVGLLAGAHILYGITNIRYIITLLRTGFSGIDSVGKLFDVLAFLFGGSVFYGGLIGGTIAAALYAKRKNLDFREYSDMASPAVPLFHSFGRIGCFLGGCCYGVESRFGFTYTRSLIESANHVSRFPIQLVESLYNVALFLILSKLLARGTMKFRLFPLYITLYTAGRFVLEFWRGDEIRGHIFGLSTSQFISILLFATAIVVLAAQNRSSGNRNRYLS